MFSALDAAHLYLIWTSFLISALILFMTRAIATKSLLHPALLQWLQTLKIKVSWPKTENFTILKGLKKAVHIIQRFIRFAIRWTATPRLAHSNAIRRGESLRVFRESGYFVLCEVYDRLEINKGKSGFGEDD